MFIPSVFCPIFSGSLSINSFAASTSPVRLLSGSCTGRRFGSIFNHSNASLYLSTNPSASAQLFWVKVTSGSYFEMPQPVYTHEVWGVWDAANGFAMVTDHETSE